MKNIDFIDNSVQNMVPEKVQYFQGSEDSSR
jgi:hypothetical protein